MVLLYISIYVTKWEKITNVTTWLYYDFDVKSGENLLEKKMLDLAQ